MGIVCEFGPFAEGKNSSTVLSASKTARDSKAKSPLIISKEVSKIYQKLRGETGRTWSVLTTEKGFGMKENSAENKSVFYGR